MAACKVIKLDLWCLLLIKVNMMTLNLNMFWWTPPRYNRE